MEYRKLSAKAFLNDLKAGMSDAELMQKHQISEKSLKAAFKKLVEIGALKQTELDNRIFKPESKIETAWRCPACGKPQTKQVDVCPDCGVVVAELRVKKSEKQGNSEPSPQTEEPEPTKPIHSSIAGEKPAPQAESRFWGLAKEFKFKEISRNYWVYVGGVLGIIIVIFFLLYPSGLPKDVEKNLYLLYGEHWGAEVADFGDPHASDQRPAIICKLRNPQIVSAKEVPASEKVAKSFNPKRVFCVVLKTTADWGYKPGFDSGWLHEYVQLEKKALREGKRSAEADRMYEEAVSGVELDKSKEIFLNLIVLVTQSGKVTITGDRVGRFGIQQGHNECPEDWDDLCPFGCKQ